MYISKQYFFVVAIAKLAKNCCPLKVSLNFVPNTFARLAKMRNLRNSEIHYDFFVLRLAKAEFFSWVLRKSCKNFLSESVSRFLHLWKKGPSCQTYLWATDVTLSYRHLSLNSRRHILSYRCSVWSCRCHPLSYKCHSELRTSTYGRQLAVSGTDDLYDLKLRLTSKKFY